MILEKSVLDNFLERNSYEWHSILVDYFERYRINTRYRIAGFLSQTSHESAGYTRLEENLNYSATRLNEVFYKYFAGAGRNAWDYHRQPEKIANVVYANRMNNGPTSSGDGWRFRGGGLIQITGRYNYTQFARDARLTVEEAAEYVRTREGAVHSSCWFWDVNSLNLYCDRQDVRGLTKRINGGYNGLQHRQQLWSRCLILLNQSPSSEYSGQLIKIGSRGPIVKRIQQIVGAYPDGIFGPMTSASVRTWQSAHRLVADGIVGPKTAAAMGL